MRRISLRKLFTAVLCAGLALGATRLPRGLAAPQEGDPLAESLELEAKGNLKGALRACQSAVTANPKRYFARLRAAYLELALKDYAAAASDYAKAAELAPSSIEALLGRQQALIAAGHFADAEPVGRGIVARDADNYLASSRLAWTLFNLKRYADAAKVYSRLLTLYPGDLEMATGLAFSLLRSGHKPEAAALFRAILTDAPAHQRAREGLAACR